VTTTATCGHLVDEGIGLSVSDRTKEWEPCVAYGIYCAKCTLVYHFEKRVVNKDFNELMELFSLLKRIEND